MKILCIHFKGGVGKSTTAIHTVGALQSRGGKTLLIDGDRQVTSYCFFNDGHPPNTYDEISIDQTLSIIPLHPPIPTTGHLLSSRLRKISKIPHDNLVIDTTPDPGTTNQIISEISPDLILIPIPYGDEGAHKQLTPLLETISRMGAIGIRSQVKIIPLGGDATTIQPYTAGIDLAFEITPSLPVLPGIFGRAVYIDYQYAWSYTGYEYLFPNYQSIIT